MIGRRYIAIILIILFFSTSIASALTLESRLENQNVKNNENRTESNIVPLPSINTIFVDDDQEPGWYNAIHVRTIQEGVNNASRYWNVFVFNGTYYENIFMHEKINLIGEDRNETVIDGKGAGNVVTTLIDDIKISGFTIRNSSKNLVEGCGIYIASNNITITNNIISHNGLCGIRLDSSSNNIISNNIITKNKFLIFGSGILLFESSNNTLTGNIITKNRMGGITLFNSSNNIISGNTISRHMTLNKYYGGISIGGGSYNEINHNIITRNIQGIVIRYSENNDIVSNNIIRNVKGITITNSKHNIINYNNFILNKKHAEFIFEKLTYCNNTWDNNYWNRPRLLPYPIIGKKIIIDRLIWDFKLPLFVKFDWRPAEEPYDI
ncbi:MAG: right-handed parallel beta-helix repeat-containing protein [Thermoplasmatales archaeon]|nr:right-handed parallel beta-helix repeat-containing protein [Thermoplasmatales archaeon]